MASQPDARFAALLEGAFPGESSRFFLPMRIGTLPEHADGGAALVLSGIKTATSSPLWDYPDGALPFTGALSVLLDGQDRPRAVIVTVRAEILRFGDIVEHHAQAYGEGERTLAWWRREIGEWYRATAARHGRALTAETRLVWEWIAVARRL